MTDRPASDPLLPRRLGPAVAWRWALAALPFALACATPMPPPLTTDPGALSDTEIERRIAFIETRLESARLPAEIWHWGWLAINGGAGTVLNTALAVEDDSSEGRSAAIVQAVYGTVGVVFQFVDPLDARRGADPVRALPGATREQKIAKLERAERVLQQNARRSAERSSWIQHVGNALVSVAAGLVVFGFGGNEEAWITGGSIFAGGELFLWSTPPGPVRDLEAYRASIGATRSRAGPGFAVGPMRGGWGGALHVRFQGPDGF